MANQVHIPVGDAGSDQDELLEALLAHLRFSTGRDFRRYKRKTVLRRVHRRMRLRRIDELGRYLELLRADAGELKALADGILITVTRFFRDPAAFSQFETAVLPQLFAEKGPGDCIRVWSVGCATGEEAYSLAMLLIEAAAARRDPPALEVLASDLNERLLQRAREGVYARDIAEHVSPERLRRFFAPQPGGYRVGAELRALVAFAPHDLLSDPAPGLFDLIACRNVLIYLQPELQREIIGCFHASLRPEGFLLLGTSETVENGALFRREGKRHSIFRRLEVPAS